MSWQDDDDLGGEDALSDRQRAAVNRLRGRQGRYQRDRIEPTNRDRWERFAWAEEQNERDRYWRS
jgi:hypothetical protein